MEAMESCVPPGFRFHPTDEELVGYYLKKKVASQKIDLDVIRDIDLYRIEPWDLQDRCRIGYEEQNEWYFFSHKDKKYPTGSRTNRATLAGFWKATGRDKAVFHKAKLIGLRKTLVFYQGRAPNGHKTDWIMHEYRLESDENAPPQEEGWVVCRAFKKKTNVQNNDNKSIQGWDSSTYLYEGNHYLLPRTSNRPSFLAQSSSTNRFLCKQEFDHQTNTITNLNTLMQSDDHPFLQLPQLQIRNNDDLDEASIEKVSDWRALDKFVASQLSQDNNNQNMNDMEFYMLHGGEGEGEGDDKYINGFFANSTSETDFEICIL